MGWGVEQGGGIYDQIFVFAAERADTQRAHLDRGRGGFDRVGRPSGVGPFWAGGVHLGDGFIDAGLCALDAGDPSGVEFGVSVLVRMIGVGDRLFVSGIGCCDRGGVGRFDFF